MGKQPFISHVVNGYSRYDVPESKAFSCTPGILYPARIQFVNARDRITIAQGIDVRSNPLAVPCFNPYTVRLHRFWVPMQLYHPEMRINSSKFDFHNLSLNWLGITAGFYAGATSPSGGSYAQIGFSNDTPFPNSLMHWLRYANRMMNVDKNIYGDGLMPVVSLPDDATTDMFVNCDSYLAYWDIVRNYYSYSTWGLYSFAWPASWFMTGDIATPGIFDFTLNRTKSYFTQRYGNLQYLDSYYETQFYPNSVPSTNNTFNRSNLFQQIVFSDLANSNAPHSEGLPVAAAIPANYAIGIGDYPINQFELGSDGDTGQNFYNILLFAHPMAVVPSSPDRYSRLIPVGEDSAVSITGVKTIPQLAIASRLQEYKDLLGAGGSRFSDWLDTFFASKIEHVDRPKLLFSASQTVNVQVVVNQSGNNQFAGEGNTPLGQLGGAIAFNSQLGRSQTYYFREPGYLIDMLSIRPVYFWSAIRPDYTEYQGLDYFNPIYNDIGYQGVPCYRFYQFSNINTNPLTSDLAQEPCFNEFRASYDEVLGLLSYSSPSPNGTSPNALPHYWVQQRNIESNNGYDDYYGVLFTDISTVNHPFASNVEDNFFVNLSYSVRLKNLVNKSFATRLSNR